MISVFNLNNDSLWDNIVMNFNSYDIYYLSGYQRAFKLHGDGEPFLLYYNENGLRAIYSYMKRDTYIDGYYDSVTPYGYGGVLFEGDTSEENLQAFWSAYVQKMREENIVDNFVRYHPILANAIPMKSISTVIDLGKTIVVGLSSPDIIWANMTSKNRNMIRKAEKNGITICHGKDPSLFADFKRIYNATMERDHAEDYYFFEDAFYESIHRDLNDNYEMFYAVKDGQTVAMSIILYVNGRMHYHLSGSLMEYRHLAPTNLLLFKAALWGCEQGFSTFHLGGGVGSSADSLYRFKEAFNRNSDYQFSIGKEIFDPQKYDELIKIKTLHDPNFSPSSQFFPLYRS